MPAIDNGMDSHVFGPERVVTDFAVLSSSNTENLPSDFTVCSSAHLEGRSQGPLPPFQLLHENGEPWIGMLFMTNEKNITNQQAIMQNRVFTPFFTPFLKMDNEK